MSPAKNADEANKQLRKKQTSETFLLAKIFNKLFIISPELKKT
tara:strand:- start:2417 stop:2545 length:129 start_codon:yes stop_codon:yes gene_type:complete